MKNFPGIPRRYLQKFNNVLEEKKIQYFFLFITSVALSIWPLQGEIKCFLVTLFYVSFVIQSIFLIRKSYALYLFRILILTFLCFEVIFGIMNSKQVIKETLGNSKFFTQDNYLLNDSILGKRFLPNSIRKRSTEILEGDTLFDVYYSSDEYGRRISEDLPVTDTARATGTNKKHAIFLGCSFAFGQGLNYNSTFPGMFEQEHPDFKSYNYGFIGYGPHQTCLLFDEGINTINKISVPEDSGFCLYTYFDDHMNRVYGGSQYLSWAAKGSLDVYINNNRIVRKNRSCIQEYIAWFLNNSETMKYFNISITYPKKEEFYRRFAGIINYMAMKYWNMKPRGEFYVGLYPMKGFVIDTSWILFLDRKIKVLNIPPPNDYETNTSYKIKNDGHPSNIMVPEIRTMS